MTLEHAEAGEMEEIELHARFAGLRLAIAFAIKAASRNPMELSQHVAALREIEAIISPGVHPASLEEFGGVITAITRLPVRDPHHGSQAGQAPGLSYQEPAIGDPTHGLLT